MEQRNKRMACITGATRGIGRAITEQLASEGYRLLVVARTESDLEELQKSLKSKFNQVEVYALDADLSTIPGIIKVEAWAAEFQPDILISCAGVFSPVALLDEANDAFLPQFYLNYYATHVLSVSLAKQMSARRRGHIFIVSSTASRQPVPAGTYTVTKFSLRGLTTVLREELRESRVKVTEVIPGSTWTSSWEGSGLREERFVKAEEIGKAVSLCLQMGDSSNIEELVIKPQMGNIVTDVNVIL